MGRKKKYHHCAAGFKGNIIKVRRHGKTIQFCVLCGAEVD